MSPWLRFQVVPQLVIPLKAALNTRRIAQSLATLTRIDHDMPWLHIGYPELFV